jgi:ElaB/YqjD/DUF883 family membrane-anchored ribosome-binding protein
MSQLTSKQAQKLMGDLHVVISDAEDLLSATADDASEAALEVRKHLQERLNLARAEMSRLQSAAAETAKEVGVAAEKLVHEHPWTALGLAASLGLAMGLLITRR